MRHDPEDVIFHAGKVAHPHYFDDEKVARGRAARKAVPRSLHAVLELTSRPDPVSLLEEQARSRVAELIPLRHGRMMVSPFAFFRGSALIMASDLSCTPNSGLRTQLCGDAHLANFGVFGTPERNLVFDVNDFDETLPGPWEWDIKRLTASLEVAGRTIGFSRRARRDVVLRAVRTYHDAMAQFAAMSNLDVWYARLTAETVMTTFGAELTARQRKRTSMVISKARRTDSRHELIKLTETIDGQRRIASHPPILVPGRDIVRGTTIDVVGLVRSLLDRYRRSLPLDRQVLLGQYRVVDVARKVVGVGSVGTRCWIVLLSGNNNDDVLFLQIKEAQASVLERGLQASTFENQGERVVAGQRLMQASSDILLGWIRALGLDGVERDFYFRQLRDWKGSFPIEGARPAGLALYGALCAWTLARAHARAGDRVAIASYLGTNDRFDEAIATFADAYADQNEQDYEAFLAAIRSGRLAAEPVA